MSEKEEKSSYRRPYPNLVWPVILVTAGILLLLSNMGLLDVEWWNLWRLWPVALILGGLELMLGRRSALGNIIVLLVTLAVIGGIVLLLIVSPQSLGGWERTSDMQISEPMNGLESAVLDVDFAVGQLSLDSLSDSDQAVTGDLRLIGSRQPTWDVARSGDQAEMSLGYEGGFSVSGVSRGEEWNLYLSPKLGYELAVNVGAGDADLDLSNLRLESLLVEAGAGRTVVTLPKESGVSATITGGVGQLVLEIPQNMEARIQVERGIGAISVPDRLDEIGDDLYQTDGWDGSDNQLDIQIEVGIGQVSIREF